MQGAFDTDLHSLCPTLCGAVRFSLTEPPRSRGGSREEVASLSQATSSFSTTSTDQLHERFLALLPKIQAHAQIYFRYVRCPHQRDDKIAETVALAWKWYVRLSEQGKDVNEFPMIFIFTVARSVKCGRRLAGMHKSKDVLNTQTQQRFGFKVEALPASTSCSHEELYALVGGQRDHDAYEERLQDNTVTPVPEQAAFRLDWPRFLNALSQRDQEMALFLSLGIPTSTPHRSSSSLLEE